MDHTFTYFSYNRTIEPVATHDFELNEECETLHLVEEALEDLNFSPKKSVVDCVLAYSKAYKHTESKLIPNGFGVTLN